MNTILLSFLCGAAFIGGAAAVVCMVALAVSMKDKQWKDELRGYWKKANEIQTDQVAVINRISTGINDIAASLESKRDK